MSDAIDEGEDLIEALENVARTNKLAADRAAVLEHLPDLSKEILREFRRLDFSGLSALQQELNRVDYSIKFLSEDQKRAYARKFGLMGWLLGGLLLVSIIIFLLPRLSGSSESLCSVFGGQYNKHEQSGYYYCIHWSGR